MSNRSWGFKVRPSALLIIAISVAMVAMFTQTATAQSGSNLQPPQNVQRYEGHIIPFGLTVDGVPQANIVSVVVNAVSNTGVPIAGLNGTALSYVGTDGTGFRYGYNYLIPFDWLETYLHQNLKWNITVTYIDGGGVPQTFNEPGGGQHVVHVNEAEPGTLIVTIDPENIGKTYTITGPSNFNGGVPYVSGTDSSQQVPGIDGDTGQPAEYVVTFDPPSSGWTLNVTSATFTVSPYNIATGEVGEGETHQVDGVYTEDLGTLTVETELAGGGTLPTGSGWDLTTTPGGFAGTPTGKDTGGLTSINSQGVSPAIAGTYGITGRAVSGYGISYSPQSGSLTAGGSLTLKVIYTRQTGTLTVQTELAGGGTLPSGSGWDLTTTPGDFSGTPTGKDTGGLTSINSQGVSPAVTGTYGITGRSVSGYSISYSPQSGSLSSGGSLTLKVIYTRQTGTLTVQTELAGGGTLPSGSGWDLTTTPGDFSGTPTGKNTGGLTSINSQGVSPAVTGSYGITGRAVSGYSISYSPQSGSLSSGGSLTLKVIYTRQTGSLSVQTELAGGGILPTGSGWDLTTTPGGFAGTPSGKDTGGLTSINSQGVSPAITGTYEITGRAVSGYSISYSPQNGSLSSGGSLTLKVIYTRQTGSLNVITELAGGGTLPTGSGWDLTTKPGDFGGSPSGKDTGGLSSGDDQPVSPAVTGSYGVTGRAVSGYGISYSPQSGSLSSGGSLTLKVIYTRQSGTLTVQTELTGGGSLPTGSGWDITTAPGDFVGTPSGKDTGGLTSVNSQGVSPAVTGTYGITGRAVSGYTITYGPQSGSLSSGGSLTLKVIYTRDTGSLNVITTKTGGGTLPTGSGWDLTTTPGDFGGSPSGKNTGGLSSGNDQSVSPAVTGSYGVTGRAVTGYTISYSPQSGSLSKGGSLTLEVIYTRDTGSLTILTELTGGGNLPTGSGWDLTTKPGDYTGAVGKNTSGLASVNSQVQNPAVTGDFAVTGRAVSGFTISYGPQNGTLSKGGSLTLKVIYTRDTGSLNVITEKSGGGALPTGSGWDLTTKPGDFGGTPSGKDTSGLASGDNQGVSPAVTGSYGVTGRAVTGYTISYAPQSGSLSKGGSLTLKVIYSRDTGSLNVITEKAGGGTLPAGSGWDLTTKPGDFVGTPASKDTSGLGSGDNQGISPAYTGDYAVTGRAVTGYTITYNPQNGSLTKGGSLTLKVVYNRDYGEVLNVITELTGGGNLPSGSGWDLTTKPGDFSGSPSGKDTTGLASGNDQSISPAETGDYGVTGRAVTGFTITYSPQSGSLTKGGGLTLKVIYTRDTGTLNVITELTGGGNLPGGSGWDLTTKPGDFGGTPDNKDTTGLPSGDNQSISPAVTGDYAVTGRAVTGFSITYSPQNGTLSKDGSLTLKVIYGRDTGNLNVITSITGGGNLPTGSGWDLTTKPGDFGGSPAGKDTGGLGSGDDQGISPAVTGDYAVTGRAVTGFTINYSPQNGTLTKDGSLTLVVNYSRDTGLLRVITETFDGRNLPGGAGWNFTGKPGDYTGLGNQSYNGGEASPQNHDENDAVTGNYSLTGNAVTGWTFDVTVQANGPQNPVAPSAQTESGDLVKDGELIFTVTYTVITFNVDAIYWDPIANVQVPGGSITPGSTPVEYGASQNFTATTLPADYQLTGGSAFTGSSTGTSVAGNVATVNGVTSDGTLRIYVEIIPGELEVIILPTEVRPQAGWRFQGGGGYKASSPDPAGTETLNPGFYNLEFSDVNGWFTPSPVNNVQILPGKKTTVTVIYTQEPATGALQVFMTDNLDERVNELGAQWQPVYFPNYGVPNDPTKWYNHGDIITGLPPGQVGLRFKTLAGWILPEVTGTEIVANVTRKVTGEYWRVLIIHKSDYNGDGTDDLAVFNNDQRLWQIASISKPGTGPSAFTILERKFGMEDDIPTSGDYDGDGVADLSYWRETTGEWAVYNQFKLKNFGEEQDIPVPGDYDGDGITDPALFRPGTGLWLIYNRNTEKIRKVKFGEFADVPVPGNFDADGDGRTDLGIFNVETQKWRIAIWDANKRKWVETKTVRINGRTLKLNVNHGKIGNVPVHADYDGDGGSDLAIYRRLDSEWHVRNQFELELGLKGDIPVPNDWAGLGRVIPTIFRVQNGRWISVDNLLNTRHGQGGKPLMSGR